jgi:beta-phosphoglucomutase
MRCKCTEGEKVAIVKSHFEGAQMMTQGVSSEIHAVIFDLDGVIVSTDHYHYLAWKKIANREGIEFNEIINNRLRGVSRMESLNIILEKSKRQYTPAEKNEMAALKNAEYVSLLDRVTEKDILPGVGIALAFLKAKGIKTAVASSSKNCKTIMKKINLIQAFDFIVDGNEVSMSKPDPEIFLKAAAKLQVSPKNCLVVEDALSGIQAAKAGGMFAAGVSDAKNSPIVDWKLADLSGLIDLF